MNIELNKNNSKAKLGRVASEVLQNAIVPELNIYNQAYLQIDRPVVKASVVHPKTKYEFGVEFDLKGDLNGKIFCFLDTYDKELKTSEANFFKSLFIESMNILLGQIVTQLDNSEDLNAVISNPKFIELSQEVIFETGNKYNNTETISAGYKLISYADEYDCRLIFDLKKEIY